MAYYIALHESSICGKSISFKLQSFKNIDPKRWLHFEHPERAQQQASQQASNQASKASKQQATEATTATQQQTSQPASNKGNKSNTAAIQQGSKPESQQARARDVQSATNVLGLCF